MGAKLALYVESKIGRLPVGGITTEDVLRVIEPFWFKKTRETLTDITCSYNVSHSTISRL